MVVRLEELRSEGTRLQQALDERNTANILLHLGASGGMDSECTIAVEDGSDLVSDDLVDQLRNTVYAEVAEQTKPSESVKMCESPTTSSPQTIADDSSSDTYDNDKDKQIRKQRNRMHAKLSRDRRKLFASKISEMICRLETRNAILYRRLQNASPTTTSESLHSHFLLVQESQEHVPFLAPSTMYC